jgi:threonylcarbamoyladenosine tRNA methylthiotransferase MtaB
VIEQVKQLADAGYKEIVLTGIHLGGYGQDLQPRIDLTVLVEMIAHSGLITRLRLSSLDPREVPERLLELLASSAVACPHLHICAQAGDDRILKAMRRNYDTAYYRDLLAAARERLPDAALGSDIIVGFPGESEAQFESALEYFAALPLTYFHVFPFSTRRGTVAAALPDPVPAADKKARARRLRELGAGKQREFYDRFVGQKVSVLLEAKVDGTTGLRRGFTRNYLPVAVAAAQELANREVGVRLGAVKDGRLTGEVDLMPRHAEIRGARRYHLEA